MTKHEKNLAEKIAALAKASEELAKAWDEATSAEPESAEFSSEFYPRCMPSFDEFNAQVQEWASEVSQIKEA